MTRTVAAERTLILPEFSGQTVGLAWPLLWPAKTPDDVGIDYSFDVSGWLASIGDNAATIVAVWEPNDGSFTLSESFIQGGIVTVIANNGIAWTDYAIKLTVRSQIWQETLSRVLILPVRNLYSAQPQSAVSGMVSGVAL